MDPPPPPMSTAAQPPQTIQPTLNSYSNSIDSSPRSRNTDSWDDLTTNAAATTTTKLRLMCSYGGHIIPRPHDKSLCYIGGDTRIIVVDRQTTLSDLHNRLSKTLLNNKAFNLKYQLPNEDLDSLISVTTDEDLENMIDEYERLIKDNPDSKSNTKASRLRVFLFPLKTESSTSGFSSIESLIQSSTKSEDWFLDALNGNVRPSTKFTSDSSSVNCLLGLEDHVTKEIKEDKKQDIHSVPDSPMLDTTSSFGSTSSSPSMVTLPNLPPIRVPVQVEETNPGQVQKVGGLGIEEQFNQMSVGIAASPVAPVVIPVVPAVVGGGGEYVNRVISDDERSEQGVAIGYRMVPQVQHQVQLQQQAQQKPSNTHDSPSGDSISSDGSVTRQRQQVAYQDQIMQIQSSNSRVSNLVDQKIPDLNNRVQMQPTPEPDYVIPSQQQYVQYIQHPHPTGPPISSYYPMYPSQQQHHPHHQGLDQQYHHHQGLEPQYVYYMAARPNPNPNPNPNQTYTMPVPVQQSAGGGGGGGGGGYNESPSAVVTPPSAKPEMSQVQGGGGGGGGVYRTSPNGQPQLVHVQPQYVGYSQMHHHPSQSVAPPPVSGGATTNTATANYGYDPQMYYAHHYQTVNPMENLKQQNSNSQP